MNSKDLSRFWVKVKKTDSCWNWKGATNKGGYGVFGYNGKLIYAHRFSYYLHIGRLDNNLPIDHLCRNRACVNPEHLEAVTQQINIKRGNTGKHNSQKTHCPKGHEYTPENTRVRKGKRFCVQCSHISDTSPERLLYQKNLREMKKLKK